MRSLGAQIGAAAMMAIASVKAEGEELLFKSGLTGVELPQATVNLKKTAFVVQSDEEWAALTTANFTQYKAIVIGDTQCRGDNALDFWKSSSEKWFPAITGNIVAFSTAHTSSQTDVWTKIIDQAITFAASGQGTGLYFTTSCLPVGEHAIDALAPFGEFSANDETPTNQRNPTHQVAKFPNIETIADDELGDWGINLAGSFTKFPNKGPKAFDPVLISTNTDAFGQLSFSDGKSGFPFVIARGAVPVGCGDGKFDQEFEDCDATPAVKLRFAKRQDPECTFNCHCAEGVVCERKKAGSSSSSSSSASSTVSASDSDSTSPSGSDSTSSSGSDSTSSSSSSRTQVPIGGKGSSTSASASSSATSDSEPQSSHGPSHDSGSGDRPEGDHKPDHDDDKPNGHGHGRPDDHGHGRPDDHDHDYDHDNDGYGHGVFVHGGHGHELQHRPHGTNVIGIEIILIVDYVYVCPPGSKITTTHTKYLSTLTRPVYHTKVPGYPCYTDIFRDQDPHTDEYTTVVWESCPATPNPSPVYTVQHCHSCDYATYTTSYPEYTPGLPCYSCLAADEDIEIPIVAAAAVDDTVPVYTDSAVYVAPQATQTRASPYVQVTAGAAPRELGVAVGILGGFAVAMAAL